MGSPVRPVRARYASTDGEGQSPCTEIQTDCGEDSEPVPKHTLAG